MCHTWNHQQQASCLETIYGIRQIFNKEYLQKDVIYQKWIDQETLYSPTSKEGLITKTLKSSSMTSLQVKNNHPYTLMNFLTRI